MLFAGVQPHEPRFRGCVRFPRPRRDLDRGPHRAPRDREVRGRIAEGDHGGNLVGHWIYLEEPALAERPHRPLPTATLSAPPSGEPARIGISVTMRFVAGSTRECFLSSEYFGEARPA